MYTQEKILLILIAAVFWIVVGLLCWLMPSVVDGISLLWVEFINN